jgi:hypothetical protein
MLYMYPIKEASVQFRYFHLFGSRSTDLIFFPTFFRLRKFKTFFHLPFSLSSSFFLRVSLKV